MNKYISLIVVLLAVVKCDFRFGGCKNVIRDEKEKFNINSYTGLWYEIARAVKTPFQKGDCTSANYSLNIDDKGVVTSVNVVNSEILQDGTTKTAVGKATPTSDPFRLKVAFSDNFFAKLFPGDYQVVFTDYKNALVYSCTDLYFGRIEFYWILSRAREISEDLKKELIQKLKDRTNVKEPNFRNNDQGAHCPNQSLKLLA